MIVNNRYNKNSFENRYKINEQITATEVRVIGEEGAQLGIISIEEAKSYARERGLDLVEVSSNTIPPVVKVESWSKFKFELLKREKLAKKKSKTKEMKEMWFQPLIGKKDMEHKLDRVREFIEKKHQVKLVIKMPGRINYDLGKKLMADLLDQLKDFCIVDGDPRYESKQMMIIVRPGKTNIKSDNLIENKDENKNK